MSSSLEVQQYQETQWRENGKPSHKHKSQVLADNFLKMSGSVLGRLFWWFEERLGLEGELGSAALGGKALRVNTVSQSE